MLALVPPGVVTSTLRPLAAGRRCAVVAESEVSLVTVKVVTGVPPIVTLLVPMKCEPSMVMLVPPLTGPLFGFTDDTVGAGRNTLVKLTAARLEKVKDPETPFALEFVMVTAGFVVPVKSRER